MSLQRIDYVRNGTFYVHLHQENFKPQSSIYAKFRKQKRIATRNAFKQNQEYTLKGAGVTAAQLANANLDEKTLVRAMGRSLKENVDFSVINKLMTQQNYIGKGWDKRLISEKGRINTKNLNDLINHINRSLQILGLPGNAILLTKKNKEKIPKLVAQLKSQMESGEILPIQQNYAYAIIKQLETLGEVLKNNQFVTSETKGGITNKRIIEMMNKNLWGRGINEAVAIALKNKNAKAISEFCDNIRSIGDVQVIDESGITKPKLTQSKSDTSYENVKITANNGENELLVNINVSQKAYRNLTLKKDGTMSGSVELGSGGKIKDIIRVTFPSVLERYTAYNILLSNSNYLKAETEMAQDLMMRRDINKLLTGVNKHTSTILLVNETLYSMPEIVEIILNSDSLGLSKSMGKGNGVITPTFEGRGKAAGIAHTQIGESKSVWRAWVRSKKANQALNECTLKATLHLDKITSAMIK